VIPDACKCPLEIVFYYLNGRTPGSLNSHYQVNDVTQTLESKGADICSLCTNFLSKLIIEIKEKKLFFFNSVYNNYIGLENHCE
jgi:hypothetical protein